MKKQVCLSIETTGPHLGLSLVEFSASPKILKSFFAPIQNKQSEQFFLHLTKLLKQAKVKKSDLSLIVVDQGPGSFTGVRVGVAAARALSQGLNIPVVGISSLEALAFQSPFLQENKAGLLLSSFPALPGEIYYAVYTVSVDKKAAGNKSRLKSLVAPAWASESECAEKLKRLNIAASVVANAVPHPNSIALLGIQLFQSVKSKKKFTFEHVAPLYLQPSWAERKLNSSQKK